MTLLQRRESIVAIILFFLLLIVGSVHAEPISFTGDAPTDFDQPDTFVSVLDDDPAANVNQFWDILQIYFDYDASTDTMYVGFDCEGVCSDSDGDGNPDNDATGDNSDGVFDFANFGSSETIAMIIDTDNDTDYEYVVGIGSTTDATGFGIYQFTGTSANPATGFGTPANSQPGVSATAALEYYPQGPTIPANGDIEFRIDDFSTLNGFGFTPGASYSFRIVGFAGHLTDNSGEDFIPNANFITVDIPEAYGIGDFVWHDLDADGVQDAGEPGIAGAAVQLTFAGPDGDFSTTGDNSTFNTTTGTNGEYLFYPLEPGDYRVEFPVPTGFSERSPLNSSGSENTDSDADSSGVTQIVTLPPPDATFPIEDYTDRQIDPRWDAGFYNPAAIGDYVWEDRNLNGEQDEGGTTGIDGVEVTLLDENGNPVTTDVDGNTISSTTTTAGGGIYGFDNLAPGVYQVEFSSPGADYALSPRDQLGDATDAGDSENDSDAAENTLQTIQVTLSSSEEDLRWDAGFYRLSSIGDYVWRDVDQDGVQDDAEDGISGVTVTLTGTDIQGNNINRTTTTDADGLYLFDDLPPGDYVVDFQQPSGLVFTQRNVSTTPPDELDSDANRSTGRTGTIDLLYNTDDLRWDAGLYTAPPPPPPADEAAPPPPPQQAQPTIAPELAQVEELPVTGETPLWRDVLGWLLGALGLMAGTGMVLTQRTRAS